jgi:hypothetical protein
LGASLPPRIQDGLAFLTRTRRLLERQERTYRSKY